MDGDGCMRRPRLCRSTNVKRIEYLLNLRRPQLSVPSRVAQQKAAHLDFQAQNRPDALLFWPEIKARRLRNFRKGFNLSRAMRLDKTEIQHATRQGTGRAQSGRGLYSGAAEVSDKTEALVQTPKQVFRRPRSFRDFRRHRRRGGRTATHLIHSIGAGKHLKVENKANIGL